MSKGVPPYRPQSDGEFCPRCGALCAVRPAPHTGKHRCLSGHEW